MATLIDAHAGLTIIRDRFQEALNDDYLSDFEPYGGADCILSDDEPTEAERVGKPYVLLVPEASEYSETWGAQEVRVVAQCKATDFNGARKGIANDIGSHTLLSRKLTAYIRSNYDTFNALGVQGIEIDEPRKSIETKEGGGVTQIVTHRITFRYESAY
jgi:hypothetical protein